MDSASFQLDSHVFYWITRAIGSRDRQLTRELKHTGLRVPEWRVLAALQDQQKCSMSTLSELTTIDRTTLTRTVDRMEAAGWILRLEDKQDMRVTRLTLTPKGKQLFIDAWQIVDRLNTTAVKGIAQPLLDLAILTLTQIKNNLDAAQQAAPEKSDRSPPVMNREQRP